MTTTADIVIHKGRTRILRFKIRDVDGITYDLTGWSFPSDLRDLYNEDPLLSLLAEITNATKGELKLVYPQASTAGLHLELAEANLGALAPSGDLLPPVWYGQVLITDFGPSDENLEIPITLDYPQTLLSGEFVVDDITGEILVDDETGEPITVG